MKYYELTKEEKELLSDLEDKKLKSISDKRVKKIYQKIAANTLNKTKNINIRLSEKVLAKLKSIAASEGIPYQTLVSSLLHKYTAGKISSAV